MWPVYVRSRRNLVLTLSYQGAHVILYDIGQFIFSIAQIFLKCYLITYVTYIEFYRYIGNLI